MPVFHTKTIESILEPVAQQVDRLVILHEEAEDGNAMPDLSRPVTAVKTAVDNLVRVGYDTCENSDDKILKEDMPPALRRVEEASTFLLEASSMLREDPYSVLARKKLIDGSRGILQGTSNLLLAFDESEVRKIIRVCKQVLEYLSVSEVVETMEDLVTFVKNLTPGLTSMTREVDAREKELTHRAHAQLLLKALEQVKNLTPVLVSSIKIFVATTLQGNPGLKECQENRNFVVTKMMAEINEIIRVLQLTSFSQDDDFGGGDGQGDDVARMKKLGAAIEGKMKQAHDWCADGDAPIGGLGQKAIYSILDEARQVAAMCSDPGEADAILKSANEIEAMAAALVELRSQGQGHSPQAVALSRGIAQKLGRLQSLVNSGISATEKAGGSRKPAATVAGKAEQAHKWLAAPEVDDGGVGYQAARQMIDEGRQIADDVVKDAATKQKIAGLCDQLEAITNQLAAMIANGQGHTPEARALAARASEKLASLKDAMELALVQQIADDFIDITTPLKHLTDAAHAASGDRNRVPNFMGKASAFESHSNRLAAISKRAAAAGGCTDKWMVDSINAQANLIQELTPQVVNAARVVLDNPNNPSADEHFKLLKEQWSEGMDKLRCHVDASMDTVSFINASEEGILRDTAKTETAIGKADSLGVVNCTSAIARKANRVLQVANQEAENSEDPAFVERVQKAYSQLRETISPEIQMAKVLAVQIRDPAAAEKWRTTNSNLIAAVRGVRTAVASPPPTALPPPPPPVDLSQLSLEDEAPPRPPPPEQEAPPRPPSPVEMQTEEIFSQAPQSNQPIMQAAHALHEEVRQWESRDNDLILSAKRMALLMAKLSQLVRGEGGTKKDLIATSKQLADASRDVTKLAKELAKECTDKRMRTNLLQVCERIPTIGTQLKILSTVKATMLGAQGSEEDQEATEMLVGNAQNLMLSVKETVRAAEAASIKIRTDSGYMMRWIRKRPWYT